MSVGIIGGQGRMGQCLVATLGQRGYNPIVGVRQHLKYPGRNMTSDLSQLVRDSQIIILSVKPNDIPHVCQQLSPLLDQKPNKLVISVAAGIPREWYFKWFAREHYENHFMRLMPSYFLDQGLSILGLDCTRQAYDIHRHVIDKMFNPSYIHHCHDSDQMDKIMVLAACAPALYARIYQSFAQAFETLGIEDSVIHRVTRQTMISTMKDDTIIQPRILIDKVASPGGATAQGLRLMDEENIDQTISYSVFEAYDRCRQIRHQLQDRVLETTNEKVLKS